MQETKKKPPVKLPTQYGEFQMDTFQGSEGETILLLSTKNTGETPLVRIQSGCLTGEVLGSLRCDCRMQLQESMKKIQEENGLLIYLPHHEGRGIGLMEKIKAYRLQDKGYDTVQANHRLGHPADERTFREITDILKQKNIQSVRLLTNNPAKIKPLKEAGIDVNRVPLKTKPTAENRDYLQTKKEKMGHLL